MLPHPGLIFVLSTKKIANPLKLTEKRSCQQNDETDFHYLQTIVKTHIRFRKLQNVIV